MTVRRAAQQVFYADKAEVLHQIQTVLNEGKIYYRTRVDEAGSSVTTTVWTFLVFLPTEMRIVLNEQGSATIVTVTTTSQPFAAADIFNFYNRYVREFLTKLASAIGEQRASPIGYIKPNVQPGGFGWVITLFLIALGFFLMQDIVPRWIWIFGVTYFGVLSFLSLAGVIADYYGSKQA